MTESDLWIIAIGSLVGISCALVGVFLVLRKMSMLGDAISHSVLLGIVLAFLITSSRSSIFMLIGASAVGLLTAYLTSALNKYGKLQEDASIGVTFTWLFAVGVILISVFADKVDLDQDCVLFGEIAFAPLDTFQLFGSDIGPRAFWILLCVAIVNFVFIIVGFRPLKSLSFDPLLATSLGIQVSIWHYLLMSFVSLTTVAAFESVGAILVVAMLVVPANAAYLLVKSVEGMLLLSILFAVLSAFGGYFLAVKYEASIAAAMALTAGAIFIIVLAYTEIRGWFLRSSKPIYLK